MTKTFMEAEISIGTLVAHITDSGLAPHEVQPDGIWIRSPQGLGFRISIIAERKFVQFRTYLPLRRGASVEDKRELARLLNENVFLPTFAIDQDEDLAITYLMPYMAGLIAGNFIAIVHRFGSMLEYVVQTFGDGLIDFGSSATGAAVAGEESGLVPCELLH
ncbi:hypothetical protein LDP08_02430 [Ralstonia pseudosolanacearum]|uniref:YbjN domain-containing protein n=1 Tax=Ralstonia pseudosolanacearum TaxID=1310165 RepID=UPI003CE9E0E6